MKAKRRIKRYLTKGIRKIRYRKGHGVHSPFAFSLITQVIDEKDQYYAYEQIKQIRKAYTKHHTLRQMPLKQLYLLYRFVNRFRPNTVLEINKVGGVATSVLSMAHLNASIVSIGDNQSAISSTACIKAANNHSNCSVITGDIERVINEMGDRDLFDLILIHPDRGDHSPQNLFSLLQKHRSVEAVIVIEGIDYDAVMRQLWELFKQQPEASLTMDLYEIGLVIYRPNLYKKHYIVSY